VYELYDGEGDTELMTFIHKHLETGTYYSYWLQVLNFNGGSELSLPVERYACDKPSGFASL
jgi:hypothetical protein